MTAVEPTGRPISDARVAVPPGLRPRAVVLEGARVRLEPLDPRVHAQELFAESHVSETAARTLWAYMSGGPYGSEAALASFLRDCAADAGIVTYAIRARESGRAAGMASYLNIVPKNGTIEIGAIWFAPTIQRTPATTEALYLMMVPVFEDLGYRRLEWKCNALNEPSRQAARRLGFRYEGTFHQHMIVKGRNRDTAWYAMLDSDWPRLKMNFVRWLAPDNFDADGRQRVSLADLNRATAA